MGSKKYHIAKFLALMPFLIWTSCLSAQNSGIADIENALNSQDFQKAGDMLSAKVRLFTSQKQPDSLVEYIFISGKVFTSTAGVPEGKKEVDRVIRTIKSLNPSAAVLKQAYIEAAEYYGYIGDNKSGYDFNAIAYKYARQAGSTLSQLALIQNNLSAYSQRSGNIAVAKKHASEAIRLLKDDPNPDYATLYIALSGMGNMSYYASKLDSASFYYESAIQSLKKAPRNPVNQYRRMAILQNNLAGIYRARGNTQKAIDYTYSAISNIEKFINSDADVLKKSTIHDFKFELTDNLAGMYKEIGDLSRARNILEYSYKQKQKYLPDGNPHIFNSQILLGQLYYAMHENEQAMTKLREGILNFQNSNNPDPMWLGDGFNTLALIYEHQKDYTLAEKYYNLADSFYNQSLQGDYDDIYLELLRNKAEFYAGNGNYSSALMVADQSYRYIANTLGKESLTAFYQLLNFSAIEYAAGNYQKSEKFASEGLRLLNNKISHSTTLMDSIKLEVFKPRAILYRSRAKYLSNKNKTNAVINDLLAELYQAIDVLERKKSFVNDAENNKIILSDNKELFDFVKSLELELYKRTGDESKINRIMNLQESLLYSRIRGRLNNDSIKFVNVPDKIRQKENRLNTLMKDVLKESNDGTSIRKFKTLSNDIAAFREYLKKSYPAYYKLRYESFLSAPADVKKLVSPGYTLVRYFFIDSSLYVLVADSGFSKLVPLKTSNLKNEIERVYAQAGNLNTVSGALFELYCMLWKPIESFVRNKSVIVIPDEILFSLNIETLTPVKINSYRELANKSLLARYTFSYQYSMLLMNVKSETNKYNQAFAGFAPGFGETLKQNYIKNIDDSVRLDYSYLNVLPQPFTTTLLKKLNRIFGGKTYTERECTRDQFLSHAGNSRIIHIGTHAFSDNQYPQYSRLIFTKDMTGSANNMVYAHDIYNYDMSSALTVLSACETGKPGYEDGEGMISLAQAFHYAGSKSILTSLWNVDEKGSAILLEKFYKNLKKGMTKDEALRQAKLSFLKTGQGRMLSPVYWAGLIIMGDTSPVQVSGNSAISFILPALSVILLSIIVFYIYRRKASH